MTVQRRWTAIGSVLTVLVYLFAGASGPASAVDRAAAGEHRVGEVRPAKVGALSSAAAPDAPDEGVDVDAVVEAVSGRRAPGHGAAGTDGPRLGPEHPVADGVPAPAVEEKYRPKAAFDGTNYLVVWIDWRGTEGDPDGPDIYGARVSPSGTVLDASGIPISTRYGDQFAPDVVFDGTNFFVVWFGSHPESDDTDILGTRVSSSGVVLDPAGIPIGTGPGYELYPAVAFDGTNLLVVWSTDGAVAGTRVTPAGVVLDGGGIPISGEPGYSVALAFDGTNFLVVWTDAGSDLSGALVSPQGAVVANRTVVADPGDQREPAIAFDGANYLLTWSDHRVGDIIQVLGTRVDRTGTALDATRLPIAVDDATTQVSPAVAFGGTDHLVTWVSWNPTDGPSIGARRVTRAGAVLDGVSIPPGEDVPNSSAVVSDGRAFLAIWTSDPGIVAVRLDPSGAVVDDVFLVSTAMNAQLTPAVASDGTNSFVVWADNRHGDLEIFGARVTPRGEILDGAGILIAASAGPELIRPDPAVAFDGTNFLVVWNEADPNDDSGDLTGARVSPAGVVLDPTGIPLSTAESRKWGAALAFDGSNFLVVWVDDAVATGARTLGVRVSPAGAVLDPAPILVGTRYPLAAPGITFDGANFLVTGVSSYGQVHWTRVSPSGTVVDFHSITARPASASEMAVASDGTNSLIVWTDQRDGTDNIVGTRVDRSGNALDPSGLSVSTAPGNQRQPAIAANGPFLVVWRDERRGAHRYDVYGARVRSNGEVIDRAGFAIADSAANEMLPAVTAGHRDRFAVVSQRFLPDAPYGAPRVFLRNVAPK
jgi:hypothetical protein